MPCECEHVGALRCINHRVTGPSGVRSHWQQHHTSAYDLGYGHLKGDEGLMVFLCWKAGHGHYVSRGREGTSQTCCWVHWVKSGCWKRSRMWLRHFFSIILPCLTFSPLPLTPPPTLVFVSFSIHDDVPLFLSVCFFDFAVSSSKPSSPYLPSPLSPTVSCHTSCFAPPSHGAAGLCRSQRVLFCLSRVSHIPDIITRLQLA